jgi:hypothetical protein
MAILKNVHLLSDALKPGDIDKMEHAAVEHLRHGNITFKIVDLLPKKVIIQAVQGKNAAGVYYSQKRLIEIVHETFDRFFKDRAMNVHAVPYLESPANKVDAEWINNQMLATGTKLKDIAADTGIDYTQLSSAAGGDRNLSQPMKALFWYYFETKALKRSFDLLRGKTVK